MNGNAEGNNDIVVRGNSPKGILWRLEGVEIPNPNHFAEEGGTGGPINALNSNMLDNSDFLAGAFAPEYGNALSGVFDMKLRNGNNQKREYSVGLSVIGSDLTVEGPFAKNYRGSYLANYRYSTLSILDEAGIVDFSGVPKYQDASFKINLPINDNHTLSVFGLGGLSSIEQEEQDEDTKAVIWKGTSGSKLGVAGLTHGFILGEKTFVRTTVFTNGTELNQDYDLADSNDVLFNVYKAKMSKSTIGVNSALNYKLNNRNKFKIGFIYREMKYNLKDSYWQEDLDTMITTLDKKGSAGITQSYISWKHRFNSQLSMVSGVHYLHFLLNNRSSLEPRVAFSFKPSKKQTITLGAGLHSKIEAISTYLAEEESVSDASQSGVQINKNMAPTKALHLVAGYSTSIGKHSYIKSEIYYQYLYDVPIAKSTESTYSLLNQTDWYPTLALENAGKGRNYGVELSFERFFHKGFYCMSTASLYKSEYLSTDQVWRNTAFDGNYVVNLLGGKEFNIGKREKNRMLFVNTKVALIGGARYTPIDLNASIQEGETVRSSEPLSAKGEDVFKWDLAFGIRRDYKKFSTELKFDIQNIINFQAKVNEYYNAETESIIYSYQLPILPVIGYKVSF